MALAGGVNHAWHRLAQPRAFYKLRRKFQKALYPQIAGEEVRFLVLGDGGSGDSNQAQVAKASFATAQELGCDFVLLMGDSFIQQGVSGLDDPQFTTKFENMYPHQMPFYAVLGNHDLRNAWHSLIDYTAVSSRWRMPETDYDFAAGPMHLFAVNTTSSVRSLWPLFRKVKAPWKIAFGHHPAYSSGRHGHMTWLERWVMRQTGVEVFFSGHNHVLEHLEVNGFTQVVSGGAGGPLPQAHLTPLAGSRFLAETFGYVWVKVTPQTLETVFFNEQGQELYRFAKAKN